MGSQWWCCQARVFPHAKSVCREPVFLTCLAKLNIIFIKLSTIFTNLTLFALIDIIFIKLSTICTIWTVQEVLHHEFKLPLPGPWFIKCPRGCKDGGYKEGGVRTDTERHGFDTFWYGFDTVLIRVWYGFDTCLIRFWYAFGVGADTEWYEMVRYDT